MSSRLAPSLTAFYSASPFSHPASPAHGDVELARFSVPRVSFSAFCSSHLTHAPVLEALKTSISVSPVLSPQHNSASLLDCQPLPRARSADTSNVLLRQIVFQPKSYHYSPLQLFSERKRLSHRESQKKR